MNNLIPQFIAEKKKNNCMHGSFKALTMFVDISGFTKLTEKLMHFKRDGAEVLTEVLNSIFNPIVKNIYANSGFISTFAGDAFTAIFPVSESIEKSSSILNSALFANDYFVKNGLIETKYGTVEVMVKIGLSCGVVNWGILGEKENLAYYFRGKAIDGCAAAEHLAKAGMIVFDKQFKEALGLTQNTFTINENSKDYYILNSKTNFSDSSELRNLPKTELAASDVQPFVPDAVLNFREKAEFRDVVSLFISFNEPKSSVVLNKFVTQVLKETKLHRGYFNKIDFGDKGGVILILFGAPVAFENNIERALNLLIHLRDQANISELLDFRAGMTVGTVYAGIMGGRERCEFTAIGSIVNTSSRLMMQAEWNRFLVSETIAVKYEDTYLFKELKTKDQTHSPLYKLTKKREKIAANPFTGKLIGREDELRWLEEYLSPICGNNSPGKFAGITYVYGEAGIGKSRLVWEQKNRMITKSWFHMPCEGILRKSFNPILSFLKNYFGISANMNAEENKNNFEKAYSKLDNAILMLFRERGDIPGKVISELERTKSVLAGYLGITWKGSLFSQLDPIGKYENFIYAVKNLIIAESIINPVVIVLEDAHWIDSDSKHFFKLLTRNVLQYPFVIVVLSRYKDDGSEIRLSTEENVNSHSINLKFMSKFSVTEHASNILDSKYKLSAELLDFIYEKTNGNPFFVEQILLDMRDRNVIKERHNICSGLELQGRELFVETKDMEEIPSTIQAVVISRLDRLSADIRLMVQTASVLGREFLVQILTKMLMQDKTDIKNELKHIEKMRIWSSLSEIKYLFQHALLCDSAYNMQLKSRLKNLHRFAAESYINIFSKTIESYYGDIAFHYRKAEIQDKTAEYLEKAGDQAVLMYQNQKALEYYNSILAGYSNTAKHYFEVLAKKATILKLTGKMDNAVEALNLCCKQAEKTGNKKLLADSNHSLGGILLRRGKTDEAMNLFKQAASLYEEWMKQKTFHKFLEALEQYLKTEENMTMHESITVKV